MKRNILFLLIIIFSCEYNFIAQCNSVRGGHLRMYSLDSSTTSPPTILHRYNIYVYYDASTICGDTITFNNYFYQTRKLSPINGTDINSDGILDGVLINPSTRMCIFQKDDTLNATGTQMVSITAGKFTPGIVNIANSSTINMALRYTILNSHSMSLYNKRSITYTNNSVGNNTVGVNYTFVPTYTDLDNDSVLFTVSPFYWTASLPSASGTFSINPKNGNVIWNTPTVPGLNNFKITAEEIKYSFNAAGYFTIGQSENIVQISTSNSTGISNLFTLETKPFVFPNPASEKIHIANNNGLPDNKPCTVIIKNIEGKTIQKTETMLTSEIIIPFENENSGVYTYEITRDNLLIQKSSFIINK